jgi:hypothetical protein
MGLPRSVVSSLLPPHRQVILYPWSRHHATNGAYLLTEYDTWSETHGQLALHTPLLCQARHMGFVLSFFVGGSDGMVPFLILSQMAFAFNVLVLYVPNKGTLKLVFSTRESTPLPGVGFPAAATVVDVIRPLTNDPDAVPTTEGCVLTVGVRMEGLWVWRLRKARKL